MQPDAASARPGPADRFLTALQRYIAEWPWTQTMIATTLFLAVAYVVVPFVLSYAGKPLPSDMVMDHARNLITVMFTSGVVLAIGKRATTKVDVMRFDAEQRGGES